MIRFMIDPKGRPTHSVIDRDSGNTIGVADSLAAADAITRIAASQGRFALVVRIA